MSNQTQTLDFSDGKASLDRNVQFMHGAKQVAAGDHMIVKDPRTGREDDVVILEEQGKLRAKRSVTHVEMPSIPAGSSSSAAAPAPVFRLPNCPPMKKSDC